MEEQNQKLKMSSNKNTYSLEIECQTFASNQVYKNAPDKENDLLYDIY